MLMLPPLPDADSALSLPWLSKVILGELISMSPVIPEPVELTNKPLLAPIFPTLSGKLVMRSL